MAILNNSETSLECKDYVKFSPGSIIDKNLTWKYHIDCIAAKISRVDGIITLLRHIVPLNILTKNLSFFDIPSNIPWNINCRLGPSCTGLSAKDLCLTKRALWLMFFAGNGYDATPLFVSANVLPLRMLYFETIYSLIHDLSTSSAPKYVIYLSVLLASTPGLSCSKAE